MRTPILAAIASIFFAASGNALANDSIARVSAGSIVLLKSEQIRMSQEVLEISPKVIRVKYKFVNEAPTDIRTTVAFPMPAYGWNPRESALDRNVRPLRSFKLLVDGVSVQTQLHRKAVAGDRDVADQLRKIGLTESQIFETFGDCGLDAGIIRCGMTEKQNAQITAALGGSGSFPNWKIAETVYWEQVFPAGRAIEVRHEYPPFVGMSYSAPYQQGFGFARDLPTAAWLDPPAGPNEACLDEGTRQAITKKIRSLVDTGSKTVWVTLNDVEYILGTGRNWKGPIGDFRLRIEKATADQFVSLCFPGKPKRLSPTVLEFSASDFVPQDRLVVHFYTVKGEME